MRRALLFGDDRWIKRRPRKHTIGFNGRIGSVLFAAFNAAMVEEFESMLFRPSMLVQLAHVEPG